MNLEQLSEVFEKQAFVYDETILRLVPNYAEQHEVMAKLIPFEHTKRLRVLDLGCGTGVLSFIVLKGFPNAHVTAFDLAENMLEVCRNNLSAYGDRLEVKQGNFGTGEFGQDYDLILSGLSTHHLDDPGKIDLYKHIYLALNPGGIFINREIVLGATPKLTEQYHQLWREYIKAHGEDDEGWFKNYLKEDIPASVENQLEWLTEAGFEDVGCHWRYLNFAVFGGRKPVR